MSNIISAARLDKAIDLAQSYIYSGDLESGTNTTILRDEDERIEIDVEVKSDHNGTYDKGNYMIPPSWTGKVTNRPVSIIAWFFDSDNDNPVERDITNQVESYTYAI